SDIEIQTLMLRALGAAGASGLHLDLGHVAVFRTIVRRAGIDAQREGDLFQVLQAKDRPGLEALTASLDATTRRALLLLPELYGGAEVIAAARQHLPAYPELASSLDALEAIGAVVGGEVAELCFDLAELRGYHYHSGMVFAAYAPGRNDAIARGGRYDEVGGAFGRPRPATGFSIDLRDLAELAGDGAVPRRVLAPYLPGDGVLQAEIERLRAAGTVVIVELPGHVDARDELGCQWELARRGGRWEMTARPPR